MRNFCNNLFYIRLEILVPVSSKSCFLKIIQHIDNWLIMNSTNISVTVTLTWIWSLPIIIDPNRNEISSFGSFLYWIWLIQARNSSYNEYMGKIVHIGSDWTNFKLKAWLLVAQSSALDWNSPQNGSRLIFHGHVLFSSLGLIIYFHV